MQNLFLSVEKLSKRVNNVNILEDVNFSLGKGESMLVRGESGCGKTTLLRCIAMLETINKGHIIFDGKIISRPDSIYPRDSQIEIGMVFQQLFLWPHMTIIENVALPLRLRSGKGRKIVNEIAKHQLEQLGIGDKLYEYPSQLSGGQRQRAAFARALVHSPQLLLLDEVTANLDPETAYKVVEIIENVIQSGTAVMWVTHSDVSFTAWSHVLNYDGFTWVKTTYKR
jgi:polar amino acid transport system ATP-binding protein